MRAPRPSRWESRCRWASALVGDRHLRRERIVQCIIGHTEATGRRPFRRRQPSTHIWRSPKHESRPRLRDRTTSPIGIGRGWGLAHGLQDFQAEPDRQRACSPQDSNRGRIRMCRFRSPLHHQTVLSESACLRWRIKAVNARLSASIDAVANGEGESIYSPFLFITWSSAGDRASSTRAYSAGCRSSRCRTRAEPGERGARGPGRGRCPPPSSRTVPVGARTAPSRSAFRACWHGGIRWRADLGERGRQSLELFDCAPSIRRARRPRAGHSVHRFSTRRGTGCSFTCACTANPLLDAAKTAAMMKFFIVFNPHFSRTLRAGRSKRSATWTVCKGTLTAEPLY